MLPPPPQAAVIFDGANAERVLRQQRAKLRPVQARAGRDLQPSVPRQDTPCHSQQQAAQMHQLPRNAGWPRILPQQQQQQQQQQQRILPIPTQARPSCLQHQNRVRSEECNVSAPQASVAVAASEGAAARTHQLWPLGPGQAAWQGHFQQRLLRHWQGLAQQAEQSQAKQVPPLAQHTRPALKRQGAAGTPAHTSSSSADVPNSHTQLQWTQPRGTTELPTASARQHPGVVQAAAKLQCCAHDTAAATMASAHAQWSRPSERRELLLHWRAAQSRSPLGLRGTQPATRIQDRPGGAMTTAASGKRSRSASDPRAIASAQALNATQQRAPPVSAGAAAGRSGLTADTQTGAHRQGRRVPETTARPQAELRALPGARAPLHAAHDRLRHPNAEGGDVRLHLAGGGAEAGPSAAVSGVARSAALCSVRVVTQGTALRVPAGTDGGVSAAGCPSDSAPEVVAVGEQTIGAHAVPTPPKCSDAAAASVSPDASANRASTGRGRSELPSQAAATELVDAQVPPCGHTHTQWPQATASLETTAPQLSSAPSASHPRSAVASARAHQSTSAHSVPDVADPLTTCSAEAAAPHTDAAARLEGARAAGGALVAAAMCKQSTPQAALPAAMPSSGRVKPVRDEWAAARLVDVSTGAGREPCAGVAQQMSECAAAPRSCPLNSSHQPAGIAYAAPGCAVPLRCHPDDPVAMQPDALSATGPIGLPPAVPAVVSRQEEAHGLLYPRRGEPGGAQTTRGTPPQAQSAVVVCGALRSAPPRAAQQHASEAAQRAADSSIASHEGSPVASKHDSADEGQHAQFPARVWAAPPADPASACGCSPRGDGGGARAELRALAVSCAPASDCATSQTVSHPIRSVPGAEAAAMETAHLQPLPAKSQSVCVKAADMSDSTYASDGSPRAHVPGRVSYSGGIGRFRLSSEAATARLEPTWGPGDDNSSFASTDRAYSSDVSIKVSRCICVSMGLCGRLGTACASAGISVSMRFCRSVRGVRRCVGRHTRRAPRRASRACRRRSIVAGGRSCAGAR